MRIAQLSQSKTFSPPTQAAPSFFFPNLSIYEAWGGNGNPALLVDPRAGGVSTNIASWFLFYLPFNITVTRYRFQVDVGAADAIFFAGMYSATGNLIFDIGAIAIVNAGQYGPGATFDPGSVFFDSSRNPSSSIALTAGWYLYGWGARSAATGGALKMPAMGPQNQLWYESINVDVVGLPTGLVKRTGRSGTFDLSGQTHMPLVLGHGIGGDTVYIPNFALFA